MIFRIILKWQLLAGPTAIARVFNDMQLVQQIMISHYAT